MRALPPQFALLSGAALALCGCEQPLVESEALPSRTSVAAREASAAAATGNGATDNAATDNAADPAPSVALEAHAARDESGDARPENKTFDDIKFDIEPDAPYDRSMLTESIEELAGKTIRIRGYIYPTAQRRGIKQFVLVRDNQECCFGDGAALYDCILVEMAPGESAEFSIRPVAVTGEFQINEFRDFEGTTRAVFRMVANEVE